VSNNDGWVGIDLDGTLAVYDKWRGADHIGRPVHKMVRRVIQWHREGKKVKIFTARVSSNNPSRDISRKAIEKWAKEHLGFVPEITAEKDYMCLEIWDDRCVQVVSNLGIPIVESMKELREKYEQFKEDVEEAGK